MYEVFAWLTIAVAITSVVTSIVLVNLDVFMGAPFITKLVVFLLLTPLFFFILLAIGRKGLESVLGARISQRSEAMEDEFPEFLTEVSLNLKSGHDLEEALARAAHEDFGVLSEEMHRVATKVDLGYYFEDALREFLDGYESDVMDESFELILISWKKGAETPKLIDRIVDNIKVTRNLRSKIVASVANYRIFLSTVTVAIAPAMMALAYYVMDLLRSITGEVQQVSTSSMIPLTIHAVRFNDNQFIWFSLLTLGIISITTSFIISHVRSGNATSGWKKTIFYTVGSLAMYGIFMVLFSGFFTLFEI
jgi:pilus assembly protein TadC